MVDVTLPPGYSYKTLPDGTRILVNDRTGQVIGGQAAGYPAAPPATNAAPATAAAAPAATPGAGGMPMPGLPGGTYTPGPPAQPSGGGPSGVTPRAAGQLSGNVQPRTAPVTAATSPAGMQRPAPGAAGYDLWAMNDMLRDNGYNGWTVTGVTPIQEVDSKANPLYDPTNPDPAVAATIDTPKNSYVINIRNPTSNEIKTLKFAKVWEDPSKPGVYTASDPGTGQGWGFQLNDIIDQQKADPNKLGHSGMMQIGGTLWGTNNATGTFEPVPGAPQLPKGWTNITTGKDAQGNTVWYGVDPADGKPKQIDSMPVIPKDKEAWGDPRQIDQPDGSKVWYGVDPADKVLKPMPGMPTTAAKPTGPGSITQQGTVYVQKADGSYEPAKGVPDPNPPAGATQFILGPDGFIYRQVSRGGGQGFDPDTTFDPVPYTDAAKQSRAQGAALHKAGEPGTKVIGGYVYHVTYRGGDDSNYDVDTSIPATPMAGTPAAQPTMVATGTDVPNLVQRMPGGELQNVPNPNYQPTDPAQRVAQLSSQANSKLAELQGKIGSGGYTVDQAQRDFDSWWSTNVEPAKVQIQQAQQKQQQDLARQNLQVAQNAGTEVTRAIAGETRVGPGYGDFMNTALRGIQSGNMANAPSAEQFNKAFVTPMPDYNKIYEQATAQALAHISPTAAQLATGQPNPTGLATAQGMDITGALSPTNYRFQAPAPQLQPMPQPTGQPAPQPQPMPYSGQTPPPLMPMNAVPGQNYGAATAYTGGISPWNYTPGPYQPSF